MTLAVALLCGLGKVQGAEAAKPKPVLTVAFAGYDQYHANLDALGKLGGPNLAAMTDGMLAMVTQGKGLAGLDK